MLGMPFRPFFFEVIQSEETLFLNSDSFFCLICSAVDALSCTSFHSLYSSAPELLFGYDFCLLIKLLILLISPPDFIELSLGFCFALFLQLTELPCNSYSEVFIG